MIENKSDSQSLYHGANGHRFFKENNFSEALVEYNKALNYAVSKQNLASNYINRSAVYLKYRNFDMAIQNIQWAVDYVDNQDEILKLFQEEVECIKLKAQMDYDPKNLVNKFFTLSYPVNPKIPFIIDGLEVRMTERMGRGIYTKRELKPGDMIIVEKPVLAAMVLGSQYKKCCNCLMKNKMNLIPCLKTASLMFCSIECREEIYRTFNSSNFDCLISGDAFGAFQRIFQTFQSAFGPENLIQFATHQNFKTAKHTVFNYDFKNENDSEYKVKTLLSILSFFPQSNYALGAGDGLKKFRKKIVEKVTKDCSGLKDFLNHIGIIWDTCNCGIDQDVLDKKEPFPLTSRNDIYLDREYRLHLVSPLINHSCFPNIEKIVVDNQIVFYVTRPIRAGEELFQNVSIPDIIQYSPEMRRDYMLSRNYFYCLCEYCRKGLTLADFPQSKFRMAKSNPSEVFSSVEKIMSLIQYNWYFTNESEKCVKLGTFESYWAIKLNRTAFDALIGAFY